MNKPLTFLLSRTFVFLVTTSCAKSDANIYGGLFGQRLVGNKNYLTVSNVWNEMDALPLAEQHCSKFDRTAKFSKMEGNRAIFDCVD